MDIIAVLAKNPSNATPEELDAVFATARKSLALEEQLAEIQQLLAHALEQNSALLRRMYAPRSEKSRQQNPDQLSLFAAAVVEEDADAAADSDGDSNSDSVGGAAAVRRRSRRKKNGEGPARFPADIPRVDIWHELPEEERRCPVCGDVMQPIGQRVRERLRIIPARLEIERNIIVTYGCSDCSASEDKAPIVQPEIPPNIIPGSFATPQAVACLATDKFLMGLPLYRIEQRLAADGIPLSRQTMANWLIQSFEFCLSPLLAYMHGVLIRYDVLHADETPMQVLREPGKPATSKSYMWLYATGFGAEHPIVFYEYQPDRCGERPAKFLEGFTGYLQTDGYAGYHNIPGVIGVACAAHMRRKFHEALMILPESQRHGSLAEYGRDQFDKLFELETRFAELSFDARKAARLQQSAPILSALETWLQQQNAGKSKLGKAINYSLDEMDRLRVWLEDGRIALSNNYAERCIRPFAVGRKNWLFANTPQGARTAAAYFTIIQTAKANHVDPYRYLVWLFTEMPKLKRLTDDVLEQLMPWNAPEETRSLASPTHYTPV